MTATPYQALTASDTPMDGMTHQQRRPMADRSSVGTTELETRDRAIVERVATGLSLRAVGAEFSVSHTVEALLIHCGDDDKGLPVAKLLAPGRAQARSPEGSPG